MSKENTQQIETGVTLPSNGIIDAKWMSEMLSKVDIFSQELMCYGRGEIMFMGKSNLSVAGYEQAIADLGYTVETADKYIAYLQKKHVLTAIKNIYYTGISLSASEYITESIEDSLALCAICSAKYGKFTAENLKKAATDSGTLPKKMSDSAISVEAMKKKALNEWLLSEHSMSEDDILQASSVDTSGKTEYLEKALQAYSLLENWKDFYSIIAQPVKDSGNSKCLRFLSDLSDASSSIEEFLASESANTKLNALKETFASEVYPLIAFKAAQEESK